MKINFLLLGCGISVEKQWIKCDERVASRRCRGGKIPGWS